MESKKEQEKQQKKQRDYWNSMISRRELQGVLSSTITPLKKQIDQLITSMQQAHLVNKAVIDSLLEKELITKEELDEQYEKVIQALIAEQENKGAQASPDATCQCGEETCGQTPCKEVPPDDKGEKQ